MDKVDDQYLRHLFDGDSILNVYKKDVINLSVGAPGPDLLQNCEEMLLKATQHRMEEEKKEGMHYLFQYGITAGLWECRDELSKFLSRRYGDSVARENLILSYGATHGLHLLLTSIIAPNGVIFVEEVTYMIALRVFEQFPFMKIVVVPMKNDIVDLNALDKIICESKKKYGPFYTNNDSKIFWSAFYTIPTYHNPTGSALPPESCKKLVEIARNHSMAVICDDVYNLLHYQRGPPPHRLFYYDNNEDINYQGGNIISNGSLSKILSPAIRLGWIECPPRVANILRTSGVMTSGGAANHYVSGVIASLLHLNIQDKYLDLLIEIYTKRLAAVCDVLKRLLPKCCTYHEPTGGYFIWIHLPPECDASDFIKWCQETHKVAAIPGSRFSLEGKANNEFRISIAFHQVDVLKKATEILCIALDDYIKNHMKL
ncbi:hypothetical protein PV328_002327 [Microctonus aethiopoides]|uniref:Aminotransferase class I/classII large domain-containing protein n=1 Tax=Microctonus aethiopoides TaxID=144406 RepID=A0AA39KYI9_9HYME|nr:hypothetical protein PV328_002327 [Microctonus aethiopoides]